MDFCTEFPKLEPAQQERFREVVTRLLAGRVITAGSALKPEPDWRFAERHRDLLDAYLRIGGWRFELETTLRLCRAIHEAGEQRVRLSKLESLVLCTLRLAYHEQMQRVGEDARCELAVGELRERLVQSGKPATQLTRRALADALRRLARHSLVGIERGFAGEDPERFVVSPLIERVLPPDRIGEYAALVRAYVPAAGTTAGDDEQEGEEPGEASP